MTGTAGGGALVLLGFCSGGFAGPWLVILGCCFGCGVAGWVGAACLRISGGGGCCGWRGTVAAGWAGGGVAGAWRGGSGAAFPAAGGEMAARWRRSASLTCCVDSCIFCVRHARSCMLCFTLCKHPFMSAAIWPNESCICWPTSWSDWASSCSLRSKFHQKLH